MLRFLREARLAAPGESPPAVALTGGVSSDIWRVELAGGPVCVKGALPRLRVSQLWEAPVERNRYEYEWLKIAGSAAPGAAPRVFAERAGLFAMEYLDFPVWKSQLREGHADPAFAAKVGTALAAIHAATAGREEIARRFPTDEIFYAIRLEPYLRRHRSKHPALRTHLEALVERTAKTKLCLVHGDVSPKNILVSPQGPVFLDAECAWYGDPGLRPRLLPQSSAPQMPVGACGGPAVPACFDALADAYLQRRNLGSARRDRGADRDACCPACSSRASTANRRWST